VDVRVVVATHRNLDELVRTAVFREDLYHRIYVFPITLPPLRERHEDIRPLTNHFATSIVQQNDWRPLPVAEAAYEELERYTWPGNVRELRNVVERLLLLADVEVDAATVRMALPSAIAPMGAAPSMDNGTGTLAERVEKYERSVVLSELDKHAHRMTETARALGLERSHLYKKCQQLGIDYKSS
jgi:two-component system nitrogen regulation response regulator NtrX